MSRIYDDFEQYSPEWWAVRRGVPTASNFHRIITASKGVLASAHKTYLAELIGDELNPAYPETDDRATQAMRRGTAMEPAARSLYELWAGAEVRQVAFVMTDCGRFGTSPDGLIGEDGCIEFKCPSPAVFAGYVIEGTLPEEYKAQCHGHLLVTGRAWCELVAYLPGQPLFVVRVTRDDFTTKLAACLDLFDTAYQIARAKFGLPFKGQRLEPVAA